VSGNKWLPWDSITPGDCHFKTNGQLRLSNKKKHGGLDFLRILLVTSTAKYVVLKTVQKFW
jgi:hypothetical protein